MNLQSLIRALWNTPIRLLFQTVGKTNDFYRTTFLSAASSSGLLTYLTKGSATAKSIGSELGVDSNMDGFEAWLDLGVSLGVLYKKSGNYGVKSSLAKRFSDPRNDAYAAYFRVRVEDFYRYILTTPAMLKEGKRLEVDGSKAELYARSSRTVEPFLRELIGEFTPRSTPARMLEVGCGSGVYIRRACELNHLLTVVGLESQAGAAEFASRNMEEWGLADRVVIEHVDIRDYENHERFDLITLYNLIYYFPSNEREALFAHLLDLLNDSGQLTLTTLTKGSDPAIQVMDLWTCMTEGYGSLPVAGQLREQLELSGYRDVKVKKVLGDFRAVMAKRGKRSLES